MFRDRVTQYLRCQLIITVNLIQRFINLIHRFNTIPVKIPENYFMDTDKHSQVYMKKKKAHNANTVWKENNKIGRLTLPSF